VLWLVKPVKLAFFVCFIAACLIVSGPVWAAKLSGKFYVTQTCPAYISKNKLTNPDSVVLEPGKIYTVFEANRTPNPSWYRLNISATHSGKRWVHASCGDFLYESRTRQNSGYGCSLPGRADGYVLALTWYPAFCKLNSNKAECRIVESAAFQAHNFTLHGLWPNKYSCGTRYGFCGEVNSREENFCDYPEVPLSQPVRKSLAEIMPGIQTGYCLQRHQWYKHGTCQTDWTADEYFDLSVGLARWFNESGVSRFMSRVAGRKIQANEFINGIAEILGESIRDKITLICNDDILLELRLNFTANLAPGIDPMKLIARASKVKKESGCGKIFWIESINGH
jgi:ribonuclease T2